MLYANFRRITTHHTLYNFKAKQKVSNWERLLKVKKVITLVLLASLLVLSACGGQTEPVPEEYEPEIIEEYIEEPIDIEPAVIEVEEPLEEEPAEEPEPEEAPEEATEESMPDLAQSLQAEPASQQAETQTQAQTQAAPPANNSAQQSQPTQSVPQTQAPASAQPATQAAPSAGQAEAAPPPAELPPAAQERVGSIISAPTQARRNEILTITFQGEPNTRYNLRIVSAAGNTLTADGLGDTTSDVNGIASWTWLVGGRTGAGTQRATISGGGINVSHEILIIVS